MYSIPFVTTLEINWSGFLRSEIKEPGSILYSGRDMSKTVQEVYQRVVHQCGVTSLHL